MPDEPTTSHEVTRLLHALSAGDQVAMDQLIPLVYSELRAIASRHMRSERASHTLQTTALVHEAFLRLVDQHSTTWQNRSHFLSVAARAMRRILVDHARRRQAHKRGGGEAAISLDQVAGEVAGASGHPLDVAAVDDALVRLAELDARQAQTVELRFFGGLSVEETAEVVGISPATVKRDWQFAKAWLMRELGR
jgi:RNA polymerase sigma factor (TIGR02999 family)